MYSTFYLIGFLGSIFTMFRFAKYCRLANASRWEDPERSNFYRSKAQQYLAATGCFLGGAVLTIIFSIIFH